MIFQCDDGSGGDAEYFRVDGSVESIIFSKNVGIGTTSPDTKLHIEGADASYLQIKKYHLLVVQ